MEAEDLPATPEGPDEPGETRRPLLRRPGVWVGVGIGAAVVLGAVLVVILLGGSSTTTTAGPSATSSPGTVSRVPFRFPVGTVTSTSLSGRSATKVADSAADGVEATLSAFYDQAFVDPAEWKAGPPSSAWSAFSNAAVAQAKKDASSLTLGPVDGLQDLNVGHSLLGVRVLLDPSLHATAAVGTVSFDATGTLKDGATVTVHNMATFLLRPNGNRWLIVGYPAVSTKVNAVAAPQPGPSGAGPSAGPSPSAS
jgi:hypothetical protein